MYIQTKKWFYVVINVRKDIGEGTLVYWGMWANLPMVIGEDFSEDVMVWVRPECLE